MSALTGIAVVVVGLLLIVFPVQLAARTIGAEKTGFFSCLIALIVASILQGIGSVVPIFGNIIAFLLGAAGFAAILGTSYLKGVGIALLHAIFVVIMAIVLGVLGFGSMIFLGTMSG